MTEIKKVLVRAPNWIGDQILAFPFFYHLRNGYPHARITSVCVPWVASLQYQGLVDEVVALPKASSQRWADKLQALQLGIVDLRAREQKWDLGISLPNSLSAAWLLYRVGIERRRGYKKDARGWLLNDSLSWREAANAHRAQAYADLLPDEIKPGRDIREFWGVWPQNEMDKKLQGEIDRFNYEAHWAGSGFLMPPERPYFIVAPGSAAEARRWPVERFGDLIEQVTSESGLEAVLVGGGDELPASHYLKERLKNRFHDFVAKGSVSSLARVFEKARFTIANDSGLAHVACLCGSPVFIVWGAGDPVKTKPLGPGKVHVLVNPVECWPCEKNHCVRPPDSRIACLRGIETRHVWEEIRSHLDLQAQ